MRRYLLPVFILILLSGAAALWAQDLPDDDQFPVTYGPSNMGREFWLAFPANWNMPGGRSSYVRLYIISHVSTQVKVWAGSTLKKVVQTTPGVASTVDLAPVEAQMIIRNDQMPVPADNIYRNKAVHVSAGAPIAVYGVNSTEQLTEGLLALPTSALGQEYIVGSYASAMGSAQEIPSQYLITAPYNGTAVTIYHPHRTPNHEGGETFTIQMDSGDVWSAMPLGFGADMSGVIIRASKPVAVTAGHMCSYVPNLRTFCCCDHLAEMMLPTQAWGRFYHSMPITNRTKGSIYRIFAKEANTTLYINGAEYAKLATVGGQEGEGWCEYRAFGTGLQEFTADKPIAVFQYNPSGGYDGAASDPFYLQLPPVEQYQKGITFTVPDKDYAQNYLNLVCDKEDFENMEITQVGTGQWQVLHILSNVSVPRPFSQEAAGRNYVGVFIQLTPGIYSIRGTAPFGGTLYGFSGRESYGYPASISARDLRRNDINAPDLVGTQGCDGTVEGMAVDMPSNENLRTNLASIELDPNASHNYELILSSFIPGVHAQGSYRLVVVDRSKPAMATVMATDMAGNVTATTFAYDPVSGTGLPSSVAPSVLNYGKVRLGEKQRSTITITNESDAPGKFDELLLRNGARNFRIISPAGPITLGPKGTVTSSVEVEVEFTAAPGSGVLQIYTDSLGVREECGVRYVAQLQAQVVKPMIQVSDYDFGKGHIGVESSTWQMEVKNPSPIEGSTLTVTAMSGPKDGTIFDVKSGTALALPFTLEPGQSKTLMVTGTAPDAQEYRDTIFFTSDAMDVSDGDAYGWLRIEGEDAPSSVEGVAGRGAIAAMEVVPNPVSGAKAMLEYSLAHRGIIHIELLDVQGYVLQVIQKPVMMESGAYRATLDLSGLAAGTYFARIVAGTERRTAHLIIMR